MATSGQVPPPSSAAAREVEKSASFELWRAQQGPGGMRVEWNRKDAVRIIVTGHGFADYAAPVIRRWDQATRMTTNKILILIDFWEMSTYDSGLRLEMTKWGIAHRTQFDLHVLSASKLVTMGVTVAGLAMGVMTSHSKRAAFDLLVHKHSFALNPTVPR